jgi:hypothetical protein
MTLGNMRELGVRNIKLDGGYRIRNAAKATCLMPLPAHAYWLRNRVIEASKSGGGWVAPEQLSAQPRQPHPVSAAAPPGTPPQRMRQ